MEIAIAVVVVGLVLATVLWRLGNTLCRAVAARTEAICVDTASACADDATIASAVRAAGAAIAMAIRYAADLEDAARKGPPDDAPSAKSPKEQAFGAAIVWLARSPLDPLSEEECRLAIERVFGRRLDEIGESDAIAILRRHNVPDAVWQQQ